VRLAPATSDSLNFASHLGARRWEAIDQFNEAVRLRPDLLETHWNLAVGYEAVGLSSEAVDSAERAYALAANLGQRELVTRIGGWIESVRTRATETIPRN
jgi:hypothetical protein